MTDRARERSDEAMRPMGAGDIQAALAVGEEAVELYRHCLRAGHRLRRVHTPKPSTSTKSARIRR